MASLAGSFSVCLPLPESGQMQWDFVLSHWRPANIYVIKDRTQKLPQSNIFKTSEPIPSARFAPTDVPLVLMTPYAGRHYRGTESLPDFEHPDNACYMFGPDKEHLGAELFDGREPDRLVFVPTDTPYEMFSFVCAAVTLYDRAFKRRGRDG